MKNATAICIASVLMAIGLVLAPALHAQQSNTINVQTLTYGSAPRGKFLFPSDTNRYRKILMHYKLRCPFNAQCGEWDYLMYIYLYDHTGAIDSTIDTAYSFTIGGEHPDSLPYVQAPSWWYFTRPQVAVTRTAVTRRDTATVGEATVPVASPFAGAARKLRTQLLWRKADLKAAGLKAGDITGMRFNVTTPGTPLKNLMIRMKNTTADSVWPASVQSDSLTTVFFHDVSFASAGWKTFDFPTPFTWNDSSNILVDISFESPQGGTNTAVQAWPTSYGSDMDAGVSLGDTMLHFEGRDYVEIPNAAFAHIDTMISIAFWTYGNPKYQPQDNSLIEAVDAYGRRVLNIHLPWSDKNIYWDAGSEYGSYDRLNKAAAPAEYAGRWNFWTFTKNAKSGSMKIYLNGKLWASATGKKKAITGIAQVKLGSFANGTYNYDGDVENFMLFNSELDIAAINNLMVSANPGSASNLQLFYPFDADYAAYAHDMTANHFDGRLIGPPSHRTPSPDQFFQNFQQAKYLPVVVFEQGAYTSRYDTTFILDSTLNDPMQVVNYRNASDPATPTDTATVWPASYRLTLNGRGEAVDSVRQPVDGVLRQERRPYFRKFEIVNRYEIARYITPYGNGLSLGEGFDWVYDVSDYAPLLHDSVDIEAYNQQELVDLSFEMVKGVPPRDPKSVRNLWNGAFPYGTATSIENYLSPMKVKIPSDAANTRIKVRPTGHGFGGTDNCAEFCPRDHVITVNGAEHFRQSVFRDDCGLNPVYPQGGTWVYNRTNWCPGSDVHTYDFELSPFVHPGDSVALDYNVDPYTWNGQGTQPYFDIETQLITYGAPNFTNDAELVAVKSPSKTDLFRRMNPICSRPVVTIRNTGTTPLTSLTITYGIDGATPSVYQWTGRLDFLESIDVELGRFDWVAGSHTFRATVSQPNGEADQYADNNTQLTTADFPPEYPSQIVLELKTNNAGDETSYQLKDAAGAVVFEKKNLEAATMYRDTLNLPEGCYEFRLNDAGGDGLQWWANTDAGAGSMRIKKVTGSTIKLFNPDFGSEIYQQFYVGNYIPSSVPQTGTMRESRMDVYPNPTKGEFTLDLSLQKPSDVALSVRDLLGAEVYHSMLKSVATGSYTVDLGKVPAGLYVVTVHTNAGVLSRKIVVE